MFILLVHRRVQVGTSDLTVRAVVVEVREVAPLHDGSEHSATRSCEVHDRVACLVAFMLKVIRDQRVHYEGHGDAAIGLDVRTRAELDLCRARDQVGAGRVARLHNAVRGCGRGRGEGDAADGECERSGASE
jgi:hypothetical protein